MTELTLAFADTTHPRIDSIVRRDGDLVAIFGTPTAGATLENMLGAATLPSSDELLARVLVLPCSGQLVWRGEAAT